MARWRRGARIAHGIGEGIENLGSHLMRQRMQDRYDDRQAKTAEDVAKRQQANAETAALLDLAKTIATDPEQDPSALVSLAALLGREMPPEIGEKISPMRRRLEASVGSKIDAADTLGKVPTDESVIGMSAARGARVDPMFVGPMPEGEEAYAGAPMEVRDLGRRAGARRRALLDAPTEKITGTTATGAPFTQMTSLGSLTTPMITGPTAAEQGALKGQEETALLNTVGGARAAQAGKEATERIKAETTPEAIRGAASKAGAERRAQLQAELSQYGITGQQQTAAMQLADDFFTQSKDYYVKANSVKNIASMAQRIREARNRGEDSPASHIGLVFNFMKLQDPTSTVREGEQAQAANAGGVEDRVRNLYNKILLGGRLSDEQVNDFLGTAGAQYQAELGDQRARIQTFTDRANTLRVPASLVVREPDPSLMNIGETSFDRLNRRGGQ